jgi:ATP-dependent DNA ligase
MHLPVNPPVEPMLASPIPALPREQGMTYEPKWDGFRCIIFRDNAEVVLGSRGGKQLERYFPEIVTAALEELPDRCVIDGELVIASGQSLDFDLLSQRIHPAASRIKLLATQIPALFIAFDLLAINEEKLLDTSYVERRRELEKVMPKPGKSFRLTPITTDYELATQWFNQFEGAGLDGLICKPADLLYVPGKRLMSKVKHERTADVVIAGFRWYRNSEPGTAVGSLLLGLYDDEGTLSHVGVTSSFTADRRRQLVDELEKYRSAENHPWLGADLDDPESESRRPGTINRWTGKKDLSWEPLTPTLVAEVRYDHMEGDRFRHNPRFVRWRLDREPRSCTYAQLERPVRYDLNAILQGNS